MNNKGQVIIYTFMLMVVIIILALALAFPTSESTKSSYDAMNCSNTTDDHVKAACYSTDLTAPIFIGVLIAIVGIAFFAKIVFS